jgi:hypothetical protein
VAAQVPDVPGFREGFVAYCFQFRFFVEVVFLYVVDGAAE